MAIYQFNYNIAVPQGRTYVVRDFRFFPSKAVYDTNFNPYPDFYQWRWTVSGILQGDTVAPQQFTVSPINTFSGLGSLTWMPSFLIVTQNQILTLNVQTIDIPDINSLGTVISAIVDIRVDNLLDDSRPGPFQIGNRNEDLDVIRATQQRIR